LNNSAKLKTKFKNILGYELGAQVGSIDEKNQSSKISCNCPFNIKRKD
jgi:hypothetical protein